jgi:magnesium-transporting ATPase (P-type)
LVVNALAGFIQEGKAERALEALLFGFVLPMSAVQILRVNLVTEVTLGLALAFEPAEPGVMRRPPRPPGATLLSRYPAGGARRRAGDPRLRVALMFLLEGEKLLLRGLKVLELEASPA